MVRYQLLNLWFIFMKGCTTAMKNQISLLLVVGAVVLLPSCAPVDWLKSKFGGKKTSVSSVDDALANEGEVLVSMEGKSIISTKSLDAEFAQLLEENPQLKAVLAMMPDAKFNFMQGMVSQAVVDRYVEENKIDEQTEYQQDLSRMMRSVRRMLNTKYFGLKHSVEVADADIQKFYDENKDNMPDLMVSRGGVKAMGLPFTKEEAARECAMKAKGRDMAKVAKEMGMSEKMRDFKLVNSQSLGMDTAVKNRVIAMKKFPAVEVVKGEDKMFWVVSATEAQQAKYRPLEQVKAGLKQYMEKEKRMAIFDTEIGKLKESYKVSVNDSYFKAQAATRMAGNAETDAPAQPAEPKDASASRA